MSHKQLLPGEKIDDLLRENLSIIQSSKLPRFNMDGIILANFARIKDGWKVCDLCTGSGIIPLLLTTRARGISIKGVEINPEMCDMATRSVELNRLQGQVEILHQDIRTITLQTGTFDLVTMNPPYFDSHAGIISMNSAKAQARHQTELTLEEAVNTGYRLLKDKGVMAMIYYSGGLSQMVSLLYARGMAITRVRFIHHKFSSNASSFLVEIQKGVKQQMIIEPPLVIYTDEGQYTPEMQGVYYQGKSLESRA